MSEGPYRSPGDPGHSIEERRRELYRQLNGLLMLNSVGRSREELEKIDAECRRLRGCIESLR